MNILFGARSSIGSELVKMYQSRREEYLCIGRKRTGANWIYGDLNNANEISLPHSASNARRILFCHRYRPKPGDDYNLNDDLTSQINGPLKFCRNAFRDLRKLENIVMLSSGAAEYVAGEQNVEYHIMKAGLESMCRYLAVEFSSHDIAVNAIRVGYVKRNEKNDERSNQFYELDKSVLPRGFAPDAKEVAKAVDRISTLESSIITGQVISVDAGLTLRTHSSLGYSLISDRDEK